MKKEDGVPALSFYHHLSARMFAMVVLGALCLFVMPLLTGCGGGGGDESGTDVSIDRPSLATSSGLPAPAVSGIGAK